MRSWLSKQSPLLGSRFATALLALTSSPLSTSFSSAFTPRAFAFGVLPLHSQSQSQSQSQSSFQCHPTSTKWQQLRGGSVSSSSSSSSVLSMSTTAQAPVKTGSLMTAGDKLDALRSRMKELDLDVYLVPPDDPHLSEYVPDAYMRRAFLTDFHGSAGTAVITAKDAFLWTDSRYWNEANSCLDSQHWTLIKSGAPGVKTIPKWLGDFAVQHYQEQEQEQEQEEHQQQKKPLVVGMDPYVHAASFAKELQDAFKEAAAAELDMDDDDDDDSVHIGVLETSHENLIDPIWGTDRPPVPFSPFRVHPLEYAGISVADKITKIRKEMKTKKATLAVFCTLDDVAYLLNMRSTGDVDTCPVGIAYATVSMDDVTLYCDERKVQDPAVQEHLKDVTMKPYNGVVADIMSHVETKGHKVWLDKSRAIFALSGIIPDKCLVDAQNAVTPMKAVKNEAELEGMRQAHVVDGVAMAKFVSWLEETIVKEGRAVSEVEIDEKLTGYRAEQMGFTERSFPTIAGVGPNGAIIHYRASEGSDLMRYLDTTNPILIDSGGQYTYGTTDVTRNWHFGTPAAEYIDSYTRVLKGHIGLDEMIFPENTPGFALDIYARRWLWDAGKDYGHGTGHGVGAALNVHEGPHGISPRWTNKEVLKKGMVVSNEPGYYEDGKYGIRVENLMEISYVKPEDNVEKPEDEDADGAPISTEKKFLKFRKLTMIPMQKNMIDIDMMTKTELDWLDAYHEQVLETISPLLEADSLAMSWLKRSCEKIDRKGR